MFHSISSSSSSSNARSSMEFSFGLSASGSASSPFSFGSSSGPVFSINSADATAPPASNPAPVFGLPSPAVGFGSTLANDQMNDVNMTEDTDQSVSALAQTFAAFQLGSHQIPVSPQNPSPPTFGQPATPPPPSQPFGFGSPAIQPGVLPLPAFQFVNHQNPSPFQSAGNVEFTGGSFSLGCEGGGDKSARRFVRLRRHKHRR